ncbi:MAG: uroporphyrinogen decarboxylase family protein [Terracidiphilus sp.]|nr:uroporphyrinogen decarboxylase family protein [Terracidiphilus sp.]
MTRWQVKARIASGWPTQPMPPLVIFARGSHYAVDDLCNTAYDVIGLDWTIDPPAAAYAPFLLPSRCVCTCVCVCGCLSAVCVCVWGSVCGVCACVCAEAICSDCDPALYVCVCVCVCV